jgi:hypothetical protein
MLIQVQRRELNLHKLSTRHSFVIAFLNLGGFPAQLSTTSYPDCFYQPLKPSGTLEYVKDILVQVHFRSTVILSLPL